MTPTFWQDAATILIDRAGFLVFVFLVAAVGFALMFDRRRGPDVRIDDALARTDREASQFAAFKQPTLTSKPPLPFNPNCHAKGLR